MTYNTSFRFKTKISSTRYFLARWKRHPFLFRDGNKLGQQKRYSGQREKASKERKIEARCRKFTRLRIFFINHSFLMKQKRDYQLTVSFDFI